MNKHTKGPWTYRHFALADIYSDDQRAEMRALHPEYFEVGSAYDESYNRLSLAAHMGEANARLVASAPDMLEVLQKIHAYGYTSVKDFDMVRDVISQATGEPA